MDRTHPYALHYVSVSLIASAFFIRFICTVAFGAWISCYENRWSSHIIMAKFWNLQLEFDWPNNHDWLFLCRSTPLQVINILGNFVRIWSVYSLYSHLSSTGDSIVGFIFSCLVPASVIFLILQKPLKGRPLPNSQVCVHILLFEIMSYENISTITTHVCVTGFPNNMSIGW